MTQSSPEQRMNGPHPDLYQLIKRTPLERGVLLLPNGASLATKNETEQVTGSFKVRNAGNWALRHPEHQHAVTASAGSFGPALAYVMRELDRQATVVMPENTPESKVQRASDYGARVILSGQSFPEAEIAMRAYAEDHDLPVAHPFNDRDVIAGIMSLFQEIHDETGNEHVTYGVPCGGGSLGAAACMSAKLYGNDDDVVVGMFSSNRSLESSLLAGRPTAVGAVDTLCEGSAVKEIGALGYQSFYDLYTANRLHTIGVSTASVGEAIQREIYRRSQLEADYGVEAYANFPETTALVAEAALESYVAQHMQATGTFVAVRTGSNTDPVREAALLDAHHTAHTTSTRGSQRVLQGDQLRR